MSKKIVRTYSRYTEEAIKLLANLIRAARIERKLTTQEVAERAGISRATLYRIENADPKCEVGIVFEVATVVGVPLFQPGNLRDEIRRSNDRLELLPQSVHRRTKVVDDDF